MLRKFYGSTLYDAENELSLDEINTLQDRKKDNYKYFILYKYHINV